MLKPAYNLDGHLLEPILISSNILYLDIVSYAILESTLTPQDWTYLKLSNECSIEIVKVLAAENGVVRCLRGQDGTAPASFGGEARVAWAETAQGVRDWASSLSHLSLSVSGGVALVGDYGLRYSPNIWSMGGADTLEVNGNVVIIHETHAIGCCSDCKPPEIPSDAIVEITTNGVLPTAPLYNGYFKQIVATGGTRPYNWSILNGQLPKGLILTVDGYVQGQASLEGTYSVTIEVTDSKGISDHKKFILEVRDLQVRILGDLPDILIGDTVNFRYTITGGKKPRTVQIISGALPTGLSINNLGMVTGKANNLGYYEWTIKVTDSQTPPSTILYSDSSNVIPDSLKYENTFVNTTVGEVLEGIILLSGGTKPYTIDSISGTTPPGTVFNISVNGNILASGALTTIGTYNWVFHISSADNKPIEIPQIVEVTADSNIGFSSSDYDGTKGQPYSKIYSVSNDKLPDNIALDSGQLPPGLSARLEVTTYPELTLTGNYPDGSLNIAYDETIVISGGNDTYSLTGSDGVVSGALPIGLSLSIIAPNKLRLFGTPNTKSNNIFTVGVDSTDGQRAVSQQSLKIAEPKSIVYAAGVYKFDGQTVGTAIIDTNLQLAATQFPLWYNVYSVFGILVDKDAGYVYLSDAGSSLYRFDTSTRIQDNTFDPVTTGGGVNPLMVWNDGGIVFSVRNVTNVVGSDVGTSIVKIDPVTVALDTSYTIPLSPVQTKIYGAAEDGLGGMYLYGNFASVDGVARENIAHIDSTGAVDTGLPDIGAGFFFSPTARHMIAVAPDGKLWVANGSNKCVRFSVDGSVDLTITLPNGISARTKTVAVDSQGRAYIGGNFDAYASYTRRGIIRLNADGTIDPSFNANANSGISIYALMLQTDGRLFVSADNMTSIGGKSIEKFAVIDTSNGTEISNWTTGAFIKPDVMAQ